MNTKTDILSRKNQVNTKEDNKDVQLLKEELQTTRMTAEVTMLRRMAITDDLEMMKEIKRNNTKEWKMVQVLENDNRLSQEKDRTVYMEERIYVPNNKKLKEKILQDNHDSVDIEHPG